MIEIQTQLLDKCPICGQGFGLFYLPHGDEAQEESKAYKLFQVLKSKFWGIAKPRSVAQLNTYWACCKLVADLVSDHENILDKEDVDFEIKIRIAKKKPALIKRFRVVNGIYHMAYISIAMKNMKHIEACKFFDVAFPMMGDMVGMDEDELVMRAQAKMKRRA